MHNSIVSFVLNKQIHGLMTPSFPLFPVPPGYRWRDYSAMAVIMVGVAFGLQHLYKVRGPRGRRFSPPADTQSQGRAWLQKQVVQASW